MGQMHMKVKTMPRGQGACVFAAAAYRAGDVIVDPRTGLTYDFRRKRGVIYTEIVAPSGLKIDRQALCNSIDFAEKRKNSNLAREILIALPYELTAPARKQLALSFANWIVTRHGIAADICIHAPPPGGDPRNYHAHILLSTRRVLATADGFVLGEKSRELDAAKTGSVHIAEWRSEWARRANDALATAGAEARIDHRSLAARAKDGGLPPPPRAKHLGPIKTAALRRGRRVRDAEINAQIYALRREQTIIEMQIREAMRVTAGVTHHASLPSASLSVRTNTSQAIRTPPTHRRPTRHTSKRNTP